MSFAFYYCHVLRDFYPIHKKLAERIQLMLLDVSVYLRPDISQNRNTNWHCVSGVHSHSFDKQHFVMGPVVTRLIELKIGPLTFDC